ncbi:MAG: hypothetical protein H6581_20105 [Bacteroidia bacterium]|nr:hypothetical protein [Bacteroidia bacterium]
MKNSFLILFLLAFTGICQSQSLPNPSFESWDTLSGVNGTYETPSGWTTSNLYSNLIAGMGVQQDGGAHQGFLAARLTTLSIGFAAQPYAGWVINGYPTVDSFGSGTPDILTGGSPLTVQPSRLTGWYKFTASEQFDSATVMIYLKSWNSTLHKRDTVALGFKQLAPAASYTYFQVPIQVVLPFQSADSIVVAIFSSHHPVSKANGMLLLDQLEADTLVALDPEMLQNLQLDCMQPGPGQICFTWNLPPGFEQPQLHLRDISGKLIFTQSLPQQNGTLTREISLPASGIYLLQLQSTSPNLVTRKVFLHN